MRTVGAGSNNPWTIRVGRILLLCLMLEALFPAISPAQEFELDLDAVMESAEQWARDNLDESALTALEGLENEQVRKGFEQLLQELRGEYVINLAELRDTVRTALPLFESFEETAPYAIWLRTRLDYFDVADELRLKIPARKVAPDQPQPKQIEKPSPKMQREVWVEQLAKRPWPKNAKAYVTSLKPVFAAEGVPPELVWIAEVESSFDARARSPAGAVGLFQLMPATARRFGLSIWPVDDRKKPEPSARAAAAYLRVLHGRFKDWRLALAAYNAGEGRVGELLKKHRAKTYDEIAGQLPAETQMYVPKVESVLLRREGVRLEKLAGGGTGEG